MVLGFALLHPTYGDSIALSPLESAALLTIPETALPLGNSSVSSGIITGFDLAIRHNGFVGIPSQVITIGDSAFNGSLEVSSNQGGFNNSASLEVRPSEVRSIQRSQEKSAPSRSASLKMASLKRERLN